MGNSRNRLQPDSLRDRVAARLESFSVRGQALCLGLSGGADSVALLALLSELRAPLGFSLSAVHVHHGLNPHADAWQVHCQRLCQQLAVPLQCHRVSVARDSGLGLEAAARSARLSVLHAIEAHFLLLAHHRDDQAETVLHRLLRGSGVRGAGGMRPHSRVLRVGQAPLEVLRPLLDFDRSSLVKCLEQRGLSWVHDDSNDDVSFTRNLLRSDVLGRIRQRFPAASRNLARAAACFQEAEDLLEDLAAIDKRKVCREDRLDLQGLRELGVARTRNLFRFILHRLGQLSPDSDRLAEVVRQLFEASTDRELDMPLGEVHLARFDGGIFFLSPSRASATPDQAWSGVETLGWYGGQLHLQPSRGQGISQAKIDGGQLRVSCRCSGERIALGPGRPRVSLKQLFQTLRVPFWQRPDMPLLWHGDHLVAVGGLCVCPEYRCEEGEPGFVVVWKPERMILSLG